MGPHRAGPGGTSVLRVRFPVTLSELAPAPARQASFRGGDPLSRPRSQAPNSIGCSDVACLECLENPCNLSRGRGPGEDTQGALGLGGVPLGDSPGRQVMWLRWGPGRWRRPHRARSNSKPRRTAAHDPSGHPHRSAPPRPHSEVARRRSKMLLLAPVITGDQRVQSPRAGGASRDRTQRPGVGFKVISPPETHPPGLCWQTVPQACGWQITRGRAREWQPGP